MNGRRASLFLRSFLLQAGFSDERRQGLGFAWILDPALAAAYGANAQGLREARARQLAAFNTQPIAAGLVVGACAGLETRAAAGEAGATARAEAYKGAISASLAGAADAFFWGALRPFAAAAAGFLAVFGVLRGTKSPFLFAVAAGLLAFNGPALAARLIGVDLGLTDPDAAVLRVAALPVQRWIRALRLAAAALIFAAGAALLGYPFLSMPAALAAGAFALGAGASRAAGGPLRLVAAAGLLGAAASAAVGWTP
jgi:mannose/fructose/N-acetylgalactosamine-specific phosphotransferase system component IID